jgi:hypothetical protein
MRRPPLSSSRLKVLDLHVARTSERSVARRLIPLGRSLRDLFLKITLLPGAPPLAWKRELRGPWQADAAAHSLCAGGSRIIDDDDGVEDDWINDVESDSDDDIGPYPFGRRRGPAGNKCSRLRTET